MEFVGLGTRNTFTFMKRERPSSSSSSMTPQNSYEFDQETEFKKASHIQSYEGQIKPVKPCSETNKLEHNQPPELQASQQSSAVPASVLMEKTRTTNEADQELTEDNGRERLKRHRVEVAGRVWIPDLWGQEELLKDWIDCSAFDASIMNSSIMSARAALVEEGRRANSSRLRIENSC